MVKKGELIELIAGEKVLYLGEGNVLFRGQVRRVNPSTATPGKFFLLQPIYGNIVILGCNAVSSRNNAIAIGHVATASSLKLP